MKWEENKNFFKLGLAISGALVVAICFFFLMFHLPDIGSWVGFVTSILAPFVIGAVIAYLLSPLADRLEALLLRLFKKLKPGAAFALSIALTVALAFLLVWVLLIMVIPEVWQSAMDLVDAMPGYLRRGEAMVNAFLENQPEMREFYDEYAQKAVDWVVNWFNNDFLGDIQNNLSSLGGHVSNAVGAIKDFIFGVLVSVYMLSSRRKLGAQASLLLHACLSDKWYERIRHELGIIDRMFNGFLVGKLIDSAIVGVICFVGSTIMGFRSPILIAVVIGVTNIIPVFGPIIGAVPCAVLLLIDSPFQCLLFIVFIVVLQQLDGNFIGPKILGDSTGLSSFWVLFSILLFGGLWGVGGMLVGVPLFGVIYDLIRRLSFRKLHNTGRDALIEEYNGVFHPEEAEEKKESEK